MSTTAKVLSTFFLFLLFSMCNSAINWCDRLCFFVFIFAVLLPFFVTGQGEVVNSRIVTEPQPTLLYFHFYRAMHFSAKRGTAITCRLSVRPSVCL